MNRYPLLVAGFVGMVGLHLSTASAEAVLLQFDYTGTLNSVPAVLSGDFSIGDAFTYSYIVDTAAPLTGGAVTAAPGFADYAATTMNATAGGFSASAASVKVRITNDFTIDSYNAFHDSPVTTAGVPSGFTFSGVEVLFQDFSGAALPDTQLIVDPAILLGMPTRLFKLTFFQPGSQTTFQAFGAFNSITATVVPAPGAATVLFAAVFPMNRRRRKTM